MNMLKLQMNNIKSKILKLNKIELTIIGVILIGGLGYLVIHKPNANKSESAIVDDTKPNVWSEISIREDGFKDYVDKHMIGTLTITTPTETGEIIHNRDYTTWWSFHKYDQPTLVDGLVITSIKRQMVGEVGVGKCGVIPIVDTLQTISYNNGKVVSNIKIPFSRKTLHFAPEDTWEEKEAWAICKVLSN